jgi:phage terminase large subunit-like protein
VSTVTAPTYDPALERAVGFLGSLVLPSGHRMSDAFESDPWLLDSVIVPALSKREDGRAVSRFLWDEEPKGSGKTTRGAAMLLVEAVTEPATHCYVVAVDEEQAGITLEALAGLISRFPRLRSAIRQRQNLFTFSNGSFIKVMASHEPSFHGLGATARRLRFLLEEVTQWATPALYHAAMSTMAKVPDSALWVMCNAGISGSWQETAREQLQAAGAHMFIAEPGWLPSWVSREDVDALRATLPEPLWRRYFRNEWVSEIGAAIAPADWDACRATIPPLSPREPVVCGIDAGVTGDYFAIVGVSRAPQPESDVSKPRYERVRHDGWFDLLSPVPNADGSQGPEVWVRAVKVWKPEQGPVDFAQPYLWLSEFVKQQRVVCCAYDEWQLYDWASRFAGEHGLWMDAFQQGPRRGQADTLLLQLVRQRRLKHDGNEQLREAALNASLKLSVGEDSRARFVKSHPAKKIDPLVALSMAASEILRLNL